jgi:O-antigen ligase
MTVIGLADLILIAAIVMTGSRTTILLLPILGMIYILRVLPGRYKWFFASGLIAIVIAAGIVLPRYNWRFESMKKDVVALFTAHQGPTAIQEPRALIWTTVIRHADEFGMFCLGTGSSDGFLKKCYEEEQINMHYGSHNNYLYFFMELGWFGLIYFIGMLIVIPFFHTGGARRDATMTCIIFGWSMIAENLMTMMSGLYIFFAAIIIIQCLQRESNSQLPSRP